MWGYRDLATVKEFCLGAEYGMACAHVIEIACSCCLDSFPWLRPGHHESAFKAVALIMLVSFSHADIS